MMKTKLTLFVAVLAVALFGVGCASKDNYRKILGLPDIPDVGNQTVFLSHRPEQSTEGLSWDTSDEMDSKPVLNGKLFTGKVQQGIKFQDGKITRIDAIYFRKNGEFLYSHSFSGGFKYENYPIERYIQTERWSMGDGKYIKLEFYPNIKYWAERYRGTRKVTYSERGPVGLVDKEEKIYDLHNKLIYHKKDGRIIFDILDQRKLSPLPKPPDPLDKLSAVKRVLNSSDHSWGSGLAPWTENKPISERYRVMFVDSEDIPFYGDRIIYGWLVDGGEEEYVWKISSYNRRGEKVSDIEYDTVEPALLINNSFSKKNEESHPEKVWKVFKVKYTEYDKNENVTLTKEWNKQGKIIKPQN